MIKGLEALNDLKELLNKSYVDSYWLVESHIIEKELKVLEIIKEKSVDIFELRCCSSAKEYNERMVANFLKLTQEEFNLLKRYWNEN